MPDADIICAIATPPGRSALAIVRISGPGCIAAISKLIPSLGVVNPENSQRLIHDFFREFNGSLVDEITAIPYIAPKSYTAEEMVEIFCHGGFASSRAIIRILIDNGVRLAEPGEFTKRAFLNGRISLAEAEAVAAVIEAKSELALKAAARNLKGESYIMIDAIRQRIADLLTQIEAEIDFSDDEINPTPIAGINATVEEQLEKARDILKNYDFGRGLNQGYRVDIIGKTNVGKSSLLNALLKRDRAIVTEIPGTTRDTLTEWIEIDGFPILLTDTAGLRRSEDRIEIMGQRRTRAHIEDADLILFLLDISEPMTRDDTDLYLELAGKPLIEVVNKIDLENSPDKVMQQFIEITNPVRISAKTGDGIDVLKSRIAQYLNLDKFHLEGALLATERQYLAMKKATDSLAQTLGELERDATHEIISLYLRETLDHLGELVGETTTEDILNNIFGRFCIGK